jgi:hypothetical protein
VIVLVAITVIGALLRAGKEPLGLIAVRTVLTVGVPILGFCVTVGDGAELCVVMMIMEEEGVHAVQRPKLLVN